VRDVPAEEALETFGGGGTTSCVPKSLPIIELTKEPLAAGVGGGGTTFAEVRTPPLSNRRRSEFAEGGGATTDGAGMLSFAILPDSCSGAETGGGTTEMSFICAREAENSCVTSDGAGAITLPLRAGAERV
jgi:hypothetical protein